MHVLHPERQWSKSVWIPTDDNISHVGSVQSNIEVPTKGEFTTIDWTLIKEDDDFPQGEINNADDKLDTIDVKDDFVQNNHDFWKIETKNTDEFASPVDSKDDYDDDSAQNEVLNRDFLKNIKTFSLLSVEEKQACLFVAVSNLNGRTENKQNKMSVLKKVLKTENSSKEDFCCYYCRCDNSDEISLQCPGCGLKLCSKCLFVIILGHGYNKLTSRRSNYFIKCLSCCFPKARENSDFLLDSLTSSTSVNVQLYYILYAFFSIVSAKIIGRKNETKVLTRWRDVVTVVCSNQELTNLPAVYLNKVRSIVHESRFVEPLVFQNDILSMANLLSTIDIQLSKIKPLKKDFEVLEREREKGRL